MIPLHSLYAGCKTSSGSAARNLFQLLGSLHHGRVIIVLLVESVGDIGEQGVNGTYVYQLHREGPLLIEDPWGN